MKYNQKTINQVIEMFNSGISKTDISKKININIKTVSSWTKKEEEKNNLNLNKQIFELRNQNFSISKISEKLKINRLKVSKILDDQNSYLTLSKYKSSLKERVQELSKKGKSLEEIRLIINLNLPSSTFYRWCKNIPKSIHPFYKTKEIKNDYFSKENLDLFPERFVIVGFIAADGCISDTKNGQNILCINISKKDLNVLNIINKEICKNTRKIYKNKKNNSVQITIPSNQICIDLKSYNIIPRKTKTYDLPELNEKQMSYFLRGYFYGDGCFYKSKNYGSTGYHFISTKFFANSLASFLLKNKIIDRKFKIYKLKNVYQFFIKGRQGAKFANFIFNDEKMILLKRKNIKMQEIVKNSKWTNDEKELLFNTNIDDFCIKTGRSKKSAISYKSKMLKSNK